MKKMGRPKGKNNKEFNYTVRMDESTRQRLEAYCLRMNVHRSEAIRRAIVQLVCEEGADGSQQRQAGQMES